MEISKLSRKSLISGRLFNTPKPLQGTSQSTVSKAESNGSWYWKLEGFDAIIGYAPLKSGTVNISFETDKKCTVEINVVDDLGNTITGTCVGPFVMEEGYSASKFSSVSKIMHTKKSLAPRKIKRVAALKR